MENRAEKYVLAMYDVRGKQNFIYSGKKCKEIVGASHLIEDVFRDYLYPAARQYRDGSHPSAEEAIYAYEPGESFSSAAFQNRMENDSYLGEVVYEGGGNFLVLYKNAGVCIGINQIFTRWLLEKIGTLKVLCTWVEVEDFSNYQEDQRRLYELHRKNEAQESVIYPVNTLPFVQVSPTSGRPYTEKSFSSLAPEKTLFTTEEFAKYQKYDSYLSSLKGQESFDKNVYLMDSLVYDKGNESLLAVIYIDGNGMGAAVQQCLKGQKSYDECVTGLRGFSAEIQQHYVADRIAAVDKALEKKHGDHKSVRRVIVAAGDEMTVICGARDALDVIQVCFSVKETGSSCAGVAIFHSHAPYADAYRIAEECCENAKSMIKKAGIREANLVDFHFCQGGIGISLEQIRKKEFDGSLISRPWRVSVPTEGNLELSPVFSPSDLTDETADGQVPFQNFIIRMATSMRKTARTNVKALRQAAESGSGELEMELRRINAHRNAADQIDFALDGQMEDNDLRRKLIYDISIVFDLWFQEEA